MIHLKMLGLYRKERVLFFLLRLHGDGKVRGKWVVRELWGPRDEIGDTGGIFHSRSGLGFCPVYLHVPFTVQNKIKSEQDYNYNIERTIYSLCNEKGE